MKVIGFNGSARKDGNTAILVNYAFKELEKEGIETEIIQLSAKNIQSCVACMKCYETQDKTCALNDDVVNEYIEKMIKADGIILASPTYFADVTSKLKSLIDRAGMVSRANDNLFKRKVGAAVVSARRGGAIHVFDSINHFFFISQMIVPGSNYWNMGFGFAKGEVEKDEEALQTMQILGQNMAWLLKKIHA